MQIDITHFSAKNKIPHPETNSQDMESNGKLQEHEMLNYIQEMAPIAYGNAYGLDALLNAIESRIMTILDAYTIVSKKLKKSNIKKRSLSGSRKKIRKAQEPLFELVKNETGFINIKDPNLARYKDPYQPYYFKRIQ